MFLYELALELGARSPDLVARAHELGMAGVGPGSLLTPAQVTSLRTGVPAPPPLTAVAPPPRPSPYPSVAPLAPRAPVPISPPAGPPAHAPAPLPAPPAASTPLPGPPAPPTVPGPPAVVAPAPPGPSALPTPAAGSPGPGLAPWPSAPAPPSASPRRPGGGRPRGPVLAVAGAVVVALALFGYMATHSGSDRPRVDASATGDPADAPAADADASAGPDVLVGIGDPDEEPVGSSADPEPADTAPPTTADPCAEGLRAPGLRSIPGRPTVDDGCTTVAETTTVPPSTAPPVGDGRDPVEPVDTGRFCTATDGIFAFELELSSAALRHDPAKIRSVILATRDQWARDVAELQATAPGYLLEAVGHYEQGYAAGLIPVTEATTESELMALLQRMGTQRVLAAGRRINLEYQNACR